MSNQLLLRRRLSCSPYKRPDYLKYTAIEDGCTLTINKIGNPPDCNLEYSLNERMFVPYILDTTINFDEGDTIELRRKKGYESSIFSLNNNSYYQFATTGTVYMSGSVLSLLNKNINAVNQIGVRAFLNAFPACSGLTSNTLVIPKSVKGLPTQVFDSCSVFSEVNIECELNSSNIGNQCFANCNLKTMKFSGRSIFELPYCIIYKATENVYVDSIEHYISLTSLKSFIYNEIPGLSNSNLNIYIGGQEAIGHIVVSTGVTTIGTGAFLFSNNITSIDLPDTITTIARSSLVTMKSIILRAINPPTLDNYNSGRSPFGGEAKIYVPKGSLSLYLADANWNNFASQLFELDENGEIPS